MTFDEIPMRMMKLGVDRAWLAAQCDYKPGTLAAILAPNGNQGHKTDKALRRIWEALDREEERQKKPTVSEDKCAIIVRPTVDELTEWNTASLSQHLTIEQWAIQQLNRAAKARYSYADLPAGTDSLRVAEDEKPYKMKGK